MHAVGLNARGSAADGGAVSPTSRALHQARLTPRGGLRGGALAIRFAVFAAWIAAATAFVICVAASFYLGDDASDGHACSRGRGVVAWTAGMLDELLSGTVRARYRPACGLAMRPS